MGNRSSLLLRDEEIAQIQEETGCKSRLLIFLEKHQLLPIKRVTKFGLGVDTFGSGLTS